MKSKKLPPNVVDMENHLLGYLITNSLYLPDELLPSDFFEAKNQDIAVGLFDLKKDEKKVDITLLNTYLFNAGSKVEYNYLSYLIGIENNNTLNSDWITYIKQTSKLRKIQLIADNLINACADPLSQPDDAILYLEQSLKSLGGTKNKSLEEISFDGLMNFDRRNDPNCVLGRRWLCKGGSLLIVGQSGTGKSSLMMQAATSWSVGRNFFGITTKKPLRTLIIQAENDTGDVGESFQDCINGSKFNHGEIDNVRQNLFIYRDTVSSGQSFLALLKQLIVQHQADIVFVDPLLSFAGIDVSDQQQVSQFLRHGLSPILLETGAILVAMHHTGKPKSAKDTAGYTVADMAYSGLGSSEFTNYFREVACLVREGGAEPIYKFGLTKRRGRAYLSDENGNFTGEISIRHSRDAGVIRWEYAKVATTPIVLTDPQDGYSSTAKPPRTARNLG
jgi:archaellum biogenesis ATPase FlaH